jgi:hypothetical protein
MTLVASDEILTPLNTEGERAARGGEGEKKDKEKGLRTMDEKQPPRRKTALLQGGELLKYSLSFWFDHFSLIPVFSG